MAAIEKITRYVDAGYPVIYINSFEETKVDNMITEIMLNREGIEWNGARGYCSFKNKIMKRENYSLEKMLNMFCSDTNELDQKFLVIKDAYLYLDNPRVLSCLKFLALQISSGKLDSTVIIVSPVIKIPEGLEKFITVIEMEYPDQKEIKDIITRFADEQEISVSAKLTEDLSRALKGLTEYETENMLASSLAVDGILSHDNLKLIYDYKKQIIMKSGVLEMIQVKEKPEDIGGLEVIKEWMKKKSVIFKSLDKALEWGISLPKGILIAGVPGCGKSLCTRVASKMFNVPLLRLDIGMIARRYSGESEEKMIKALRIAETISPCILWIDELEKIFSGVSGTEIRLFDTFLRWMQNKSGPVFVISTANKMDFLPNELFENEIFDEMFYAGLPSKEERKKIFEIHIGKRRNQDLKIIGTDMLALLTDGYSGADIEKAVADAVENAFADGCNRLSTKYIENAVGKINSVSEIMRDDIDKLTDFYKNRNLKNASLKMED